MATAVKSITSKMLLPTLLMGCQAYQPPEYWYPIRVLLNDEVYAGGLVRHVADWRFEIHASPEKRCTGELRLPAKDNRVRLHMQCGDSSVGPIRLDCFPRRQQCLVKYTMQETPIIIALSRDLQWLDGVIPLPPDHPLSAAVRPH